MSNVSIIKNSFFQRVFSLSRAITVDDKQKVLDDLCKEDSNKFFDEFKKLMASKNKIPEKNNITQKNINILITSCGYDIGITASITVAIIYHLSKINKSTSLDVAFITENLNKYLNLSKHNVNQVIKYIDQMKKNINPKYTSKIYLNESIVLNNYIIEYPEELQSQEEYFSENNEYREDNLNYRIIFDDESNYNFLSNENSISNFKKVNMMNNIQSIKNHLKTYHSTKNLTWKENKQKASLAIYNYINKELEKIKINSINDIKEEKERKTVGIKKIKYTLEYVLDQLQKSFNSGNENSLSLFNELEDEIKNRLNEEIYNNLTGNFVVNDESKKYKKLLKNLKIIVTHKNTDGIWNNSNTKTPWFANSSNKYNIRTDTHEKIIQAINKDRGYAKLPVIKGLIDKISDENHGYSGKTSYFQPFFRKAYLDKDGFGILKLSSEFNCAILKAKWSNGIPISGQIKPHTDNAPLKNAIEFIRNKNGSYTFIRKVENSDKTIIEYKFTTKTFKEKLHIITGTRESLNKLSIVKTLDNKQIVLEKTFPRMDTIEFLKECNDGLISSESTTLTLKNPSQSYDENFKASLALAVVYHLIKVSKVLDDSIANNNKIDFDKLEYYINLFMGLTKNAVAQIIKYVEKMYIGEIEDPITVDTKEYKLFLNIDINNTPAINLKELSEILVKNKNIQALRYVNENQKTINKQIINQLSIKNANEDKTVKEELSCLIKEIDEPIVKLNPFGLKNFENDCFIISAIQFILNNEILLNAILDHPDEEIKENFAKMLLTKGKNEKISKLLMKRIREIANIGEGVQDATEVVLRALFGSYDKLIGYKTIKNQEDLKIKNIFEYLNDNKNHINLLKEVIKNIYSNYLTEEHKALKDFLLNEFKDEQFIQLKELFGNKKFIEFKDIIDNKDFLILLQKLIHHEEFQQKMNKERKMFLWFDVSNYGAKQKGDKINLGMPLKWSEIPHNENVNAIVIHEGKTVNSGHYFTYIKKNDKWYECNDNKVRKISDITEETQNKRIAIFSYEYKKYITTENDNFRYEGEINEKGEMHGRGKIFWKDTQHTYIGDFVNDCPCGSGLLYKYNSTFSVIFEKIGDKESKVTKEEEIKIYNNLSGI